MTHACIATVAWVTDQLFCLTLYNRLICISLVLLSLNRTCTCSLPGMDHSLTRAVLVSLPSEIAIPDVVPYFMMVGQSEFPPIVGLT